MSFPIPPGGEEHTDQEDRQNEKRDHAPPIVALASKTKY